MSESKNDKFKRLAARRTLKALKYIDSIKNLSNRGNYEYSEEEYKSIVRALKSAVVQLEQAFATEKIDTRENFLMEFSMKQGEYPDA